jgi:hypothetical protein
MTQPQVREVDSEPGAVIGATVYLPRRLMVLMARGYRYLSPVLLIRISISLSPVPGVVSTVEVGLGKGKGTRKS